uniref:Uncharacterized protein n=1 Tax=Siphoviridae sp. ctLeh52 TaxID=2827849 RepID=A0A8S5RWL9_9CAUD|nr:MAG TPA: hypothetical protein [Siphoviridae sp. ctLeh52]
MVKCNNCKNLETKDNGFDSYLWCEKINDCPHEEIERGCKDYAPMTNADRIRNMTDEELLDFICSIETYDDGSAKTIEGGVAMCSVTEVEQWLKAERK